MANLTLVSQENRLGIRSQAFCLTLKKSWANPKVLFIVLRAVRSPETGPPLFTYQQIAEVFGYQHRQNIQNFWQEFEPCGEELRADLQHKRKVDQAVGEAVTEAVRQRPLAKGSLLCQQGSTQVARSDLPPANIQTALAEVPWTVIRPILQPHGEEGRFHPKEEVVLHEALAAVRSSSALPPTGADDLQALGLAPQELAEEQAVQRQQAAAIAGLLNPRATVEQVSAPIRRMVLALTRYFWNVPLSRIGRWWGVSKSTVLNGGTGLAVAVSPTIQAWIVSGVAAVSVALDEKWLKLRQTGPYWFVGLAEATGLPVVRTRRPTRTTWAWCWVRVSLKRLGILPRAIITAGLGGDLTRVRGVFPPAKHRLCLFHHQPGGTRWRREYAARLPEDVVAALNRQRKRVVQTCDPRPVRRRLTCLATAEGAQQRGWDSWITRTRERLGHLVPARRRNAYPRTTNSIERFFRAFQRCYKTRGGFHSVVSAKRELLLFVVGYVFTKQASTGPAPIERIVPQATQIPFYTLLNDPFRQGLANRCQANPGDGLFLATQPSSQELKQA
jgi:hypothetical protein